MLAALQASSHCGFPISAFRSVSLTEFGRWAAAGGSSATDSKFVRDELDEGDVLQMLDTLRNMCAI
jgi:hypothetical protein